MQQILTRVYHGDQQDVEAGSVRCASSDSEPHSPGTPGSAAGLHGVSEATLAALVSDQPVDMASLPDAEQRALLSALAQLNVASLVPEWSAWWLAPGAAEIRLRRDGTRLVAPMGIAAGDTASEEHSVAPQATCNDSTRASGVSEDTDACVAQGSPPPPPAEPCAPVAQLCGGSAAPQVPLALLQLVCAYCYALRLYNGDADADPVTWLQLLWKLCASLGGESAGEQLPRSVAEALEQFGGQLRLPPADVAQARALTLAVATDATALLKAGQGAVVCALAHVQRCHARVCRDKSIASGSRQPSKPVRHRLKVAMHKLRFLLSIANELQADQVALLLRELDVYCRDLRGETGTRESDVTLL
jgi:hypothetical protein